MMCMLVFLDRIARLRNDYDDDDQTQLPKGCDVMRFLENLSSFHFGETTKEKECLILSLS